MRKKVQWKKSFLPAPEKKLKTGPLISGEGISFPVDFTLLADIPGPKKIKFISNSQYVTRVVS